MGFTLAVGSAFRKYANSSGRASRSEYWWFFLFVVAGLIAGAALDTFAGFESVRHLFALGVLPPWASLTIRRLHDTDRSGYWFLIQTVPLLGLIFLLALMMLPGTDASNRFGEPRLKA